MQRLGRSSQPIAAFHFFPGGEAAFSKAPFTFFFLASQFIAVGKLQLVKKRLHRLVGMQNVCKCQVSIATVSGGDRTQGRDRDEFPGWSWMPVQRRNSEIVLVDIRLRENEWLAENDLLAVNCDFAKSSCINGGDTGLESSFDSHL
jgi:hypothetical protein